MTAERSERILPASVDVIIAVWNNAGTIARAVRSALAAPEVNRVIVVDDRSTDDTAAVVAALIDEFGARLHLERMERNGGPAAARNRALALSDAPWVTILDGDDYFALDRLRGLLSVSDGADLVADDLLQVREGAETANGSPLLGLDQTVTLDLATFVAGNISQAGRLRKEYGFLKPMLRRAFLVQHGLRYDEELRLGEDFALYARALAAGAVFRVIPSATYVSVVRAGSLSGNHTKRDLERLRDSDKSLLRLTTLTADERRLIRQHYESIDARVQWLNVIDAVKARDVGAFLAPFLIRWSTCSFLVSRLLEQVVLRSRRLLGMT
ncbi:MULTISPECIES: glycosyltransferase family 2 protein [unclassified Bradyrhizobium]|uniref:glycosyltransferase family 2 protein n=1 Tax=unclassified Bradyrhizobium TaxID=2631580 RepID=UPI0028EF1EB5|nr:MULTISPECIES: glycosyltransferase family 2 protein [unclassified Bradyrhizobium]